MGSPDPKKNTRSTPVLQALLLADHIYTEESGKRVICGTFSRIFSLRFPTITSFSPWAFVLLVDVVGEVVLQLRFVCLEDNQILMESNPVTIKSVDPLAPLDIAMRIPPFPLPRAGIYSFECWADETMIGSVRLQVVQSLVQEKSSD
jgi:hypothetical protein